MNLKSGVFKGKPVYIIAIFVLLAALVISLLWAVTIGTVDISVGDVYKVIAHKLFGLFDAETYGQGSISDIVWYVRLPRLVLGIGIGVCLSVSGCVMQSVVRNPLADPYVLGVSSGASLGATVAILFGAGSVFGSGYTGVMAFLGAFLTSLAVVALANIGGRSNSVKLVLAGCAMSAICSAISNFLLFVISQSDSAVSAVVRWTMGTLAGAEWPSNILILCIAAAGFIFFWSQHRTLDLMLLGDDTAVTLGTDLHKRRTLYLAVASLMIGFAVYASGVIGFVGLIIPHVVRMLFGTAHKKLIPLSALLGAIFLLWSDVLCRVLIPNTELPIGILTAMIGAPVFIYLMARKKYGFGGGD